MRHYQFRLTGSQLFAKACLDKDLFRWKIILKGLTPYYTMVRFKRENWEGRIEFKTTIWKAKFRNTEIVLSVLVFWSFPKPIFVKALPLLQCTAILTNINFGIWTHCPLKEVVYRLDSSNPHLWISLLHNDLVCSCSRIDIAQYCPRTIH